MMFAGVSIVVSHLMESGTDDDTGLAVHNSSFCGGTSMKVFNHFVLPQPPPPPFTCNHMRGVLCTSLNGPLLKMGGGLGCARRIRV